MVWDLRGIGVTGPRLLLRVGHVNKRGWIVVGGRLDEAGVLKGQESQLNGDAGYMMGDGRRMENQQREFPFEVVDPHEHRSCATIAQHVRQLQPP